MENRFHCIFSPVLLKLLSESQKPFQAQSFALCIFILFNFIYYFNYPWPNSSLISVHWLELSKLEDGLGACETNNMEGSNTVTYSTEGRKTI